MLDDYGHFKQEAPADGGDDGGESEPEFAPDGSVQRGRRRVHFTVAQLQLYYHLPLKAVREELDVEKRQETDGERAQAARALGICEAALKRICRRNRIKKWPFRRLQSVMRRIEDATRGGDASRHSFMSVDDDGSDITDFLLPHELESRRKMTADNDLSFLDFDDEDALATKLQMLEEERRTIIETAHISFPKEEMYASFPMPDSFDLSTPLDLLASLCVSSCKKATPRAMPCAEDNMTVEMDDTPAVELNWMTETA